MTVNLAALEAERYRPVPGPAVAYPPGPTSWAAQDADRRKTAPGRVVLGLPPVEFEKRMTVLLGRMAATRRARPAAPDDDAAWESRAACTAPGVDPEWFYTPDSGPDLTSDEVPVEEARRVELARGVCARCPVAVECARGAAQDRFGFRAGVSARERGWGRYGQPLRKGKAA